MGCAILNKSVYNMTESGAGSRFFVSPTAPKNRRITARKRGGIAAAQGKACSRITLNGKVENKALIQLEVAKNKLQKACSGSILKI